MLLSVSFKQLIFFEFGVDVSSFILLFDFFCLNCFVFNDYMFILPSSPDLILNFFLLLWCLLNCGDYASLSSRYFNQLVFLHLLDYHFSSSLLSLMLFLLIFAIWQSTLLSSLQNWFLPLRFCFDVWFFIDFFFLVRR